MTQTVVLSTRIADLERKVNDLPRLQRLMQGLAVQIQEAEEAKGKLNALEVLLLGEEQENQQPTKQEPGAPVFESKSLIRLWAERTAKEIEEIGAALPRGESPVMSEAVPAVEEAPAEVEAQPVEVVHQVVEVEGPAPLVSEEAALVPDDEDEESYTSPRDLVLAHCSQTWGTILEIRAATRLGGSTVGNVCAQLYRESLIERRGVGKQGSPYEYGPKTAPTEAVSQPEPKPAPPVPTVKEQVQAKAQRINHQANLPRDLPPLPVKTKPVTPDDIDAVRKALADRPSKSASVALLAGRINRSAAHTEAVLAFMVGEVTHEGNQWRLA